MLTIAEVLAMPTSTTHHPTWNGVVILYLWDNISTGAKPCLCADFCRGLADALGYDVVTATLADVFSERIVLCRSYDALVAEILVAGKSVGALYLRGRSFDDGEIRVTDLTTLREALAFALIGVRDCRAARVILDDSVQEVSPATLWLPEELFNP